MKEFLRNYDYFYIENFHRFKNPLKFQLRPFTIFVGPNGSGKSALSLAIKLFIDSCKYIFRDEKTRTEFFKRKEYYSLFRSEDQKFKLRKEYSKERKYIEFSYTKNEEFLDISSFEYGNLDDNKNKKKLFSFDTKFPASNYLNNLTKDDFVDYWCNNILSEAFDTHEKMEMLEIFRELLRDTASIGVTGIETSNIGLITFISEEYIKNANEFDYSINSNLLRFLIFREDQFYIDFEEEKVVNIIVEPVRNFDKRKLRGKRREPNIIDYFVNEFGIQQIKDFTFLDLMRHLMVSYIVSFLIKKELEQILDDDVNLLNYKILDEIRLEPPEFLEVRNNKIINDYYGIFDTLQNISSSEKRKFFKDLKNFGIAEKITVEKSGFRRPNANYYEITLNSNSDRFPIKNLSSGGKQFLPILLYLYFEQDYTNVWFFFKQPELHLHPRLQMRIPELLVSKNVPQAHFEIKEGDIIIHRDIKKFSNFFIIETHSEHIIRKFQLLIANSEYPYFTNKDIAIIYVQPDERTLNSSIKIMELDEKGNFIDNWPAGFFDESAELSYALLEAQIKRKN